MRRRLLACFLVLDGLCALALPAVASVLPPPAHPASYVEVAGACVEALPGEAGDVAGRVVPLSFCQA